MEIKFLRRAAKKHILNVNNWQVFAINHQICEIQFAKMWYKKNIFTQGTYLAKALFDNVTWRTDIQFRVAVPVSFKRIKEEDNSTLN